MDEIKLTTLSEADLGKVQMFCGHSPTYRAGYKAKEAWLKGRLAEGMRYTLLTVNGHNAGMIETIPGEFAWRGVDASGYLFIHCFWVIGRNRKHGFGSQLLEACLKDASGTAGVAVLSSKTHWLPTRKIFLKNGFKVVDEFAPFELLVYQLNENARLPRIKREPVDIPPGLVLYHSDQCPYMQNLPEIVEKAGAQLGIPVTLNHVTSGSKAQSSPCPYGVNSIYLDGVLLDYRPLGLDSLFERVKATQQQIKER